MSKKFRLVKFEVTDGEHGYFDYHIFFTSDFQKMSEMELIAHFYEGDKNIRLDEETKGVYWLYDGMRTVSVINDFPIGLETAKCLKDLRVIYGIPQPIDIIFKKFNNIVQLKTKREP